MTECPNSVVPVLVGVVAAGDVVAGVHTELEPKHAEAPKPPVQRLHIPRRRAVPLHFWRLGFPGV